MTHRSPSTLRRRADLPRLVGVIAALLAAAPCLGDRVRNVDVGQPVPPFAVRTIDGADLKSEDLRGKVVVVVYVAAEQQSSERAIRAASRVARELRREELAIVSLTADVAQIGFFRQQRSRLELQEPLGLDVDRRFYGALGVIVLPATIIIDRDGKLAHVLSSYKADYEHALRARVRHTLGLIDDAELKTLLTTKSHRRDDASDRVARHRAAAALLRGKGLLPDAERELRSALEIDPADADALLDLASLCIAQNRVAEADTLVAQAAAVAPDHRRGRLMLGVVLLQRDRLEEAERVLQEALLLNPDPARTHYELGLVRERRGDLAGANQHFKEALTRLLEDKPL